MANTEKLTTEKLEEFLTELTGYPNVTAACEKIKISRTAIYKERHADQKFADAWDQAMKIGVQACEDEAHRRAFQGSVKITKYGTYKEYSDVLAIFLLKAHNPEKYMDRSRSELTGKDGQPLGDMNDAQVAAKLDVIAKAAAARMKQAQSPAPASDDFDDLA
jgi:hypothetical protein